MNRMYFVYGTHKVKNFENWRKVFDAGEKLRQKAEIEVRKIFRSVNDPNEIHFLLESTSADSVYEFFRSDVLKKNMNEAGVIGEPVFHILELV